MFWRHDVSSEWLKARRDFLTASDVRSLLSCFKRIGWKWEPGDPIPDPVLTLFGEKHQICEPETGSPSQAAARGHVLESHAIDEWNVRHSQWRGPMYHWDDVLIYNSERLAFSPDATNIRQPESLPPAIYVENSYLDGLEMIAEIKSYGAANHIKALMKGKDKLEELWQVATAMAVDERIKRASLVFYNPGSRYPWRMVMTNRTDMAEKIDTIETANRLYWKISDSLERELRTKEAPVLFTEDQIIQMETPLYDVSTQGV